MKDLRGREITVGCTVLTFRPDSLGTIATVLEVRGGAMPLVRPVSDIDRNGYLHQAVDLPELVQPSLCLVLVR